MSTRGALGFRIKNQDKVTYNHSDSYPSWLGIKVLTFVHDTPDTELNEIAERIELVDEDSKPTSEQIEKYMEFADVNVSNNSLTDWYCLLRNTQGDLSHYRNGLRHMIDSQLFLRDSGSCEWAYIINTDTGELEIYRGRNKNRHVKNGGRYSRYRADDNDFGGKKYYGVTLLSTLKLLEIQRMTLEEIKLFCKALEESVYQASN